MSENLTNLFLVGNDPSNIGGIISFMIILMVIGVILSIIVPIVRRFGSGLGESYDEEEDLEEKRFLARKEVKDFVASKLNKKSKKSYSKIKKTEIESTDFEGKSEFD